MPNNAGSGQLHMQLAHHAPATAPLPSAWLTSVVCMAVTTIAGANTPWLSPDGTRMLVSMDRTQPGRTAYSSQGLAVHDTASGVRILTVGPDMRFRPFNYAWSRSDGVRACICSRVQTGIDICIGASKCPRMRAHKHAHSAQMLDRMLPNQAPQSRNVTSLTIQERCCLLFACLPACLPACLNDGRDLWSRDGCAVVIAEEARVPKDGGDVVHVACALTGVLLRSIAFQPPGARAAILSTFGRYAFLFAAAGPDGLEDPRVVDTATSATVLRPADVAYQWHRTEDSIMIVDCKSCDVRVEAVGECCPRTLFACNYLAGSSSHLELLAWCWEPFASIMAFLCQRQGELAVVDALVIINTASGSVEHVPFNNMDLCDITCAPNMPFVAITADDADVGLAAAYTHCIVYDASSHDECFHRAKSKWDGNSRQWLSAWSPNSQWLIMYLLDDQEFHVVSSKTWLHVVSVIVGDKLDRLQWTPDGCSLVLVVENCGDTEDQHAQAVKVLHFSGS